MPVQPVATQMRHFASDTGMARFISMTVERRAHAVLEIRWDQVPAHRHRRERGGSLVFGMGTGIHTSSSADVDCGTDCVGRCTQ